MTRVRFLCLRARSPMSRLGCLPVSVRWVVIHIWLNGVPVVGVSSRLAVAAFAVTRRIALSSGPSAMPSRGLACARSGCLRLGVPSSSAVLFSSSCCAGRCGSQEVLTLGQSSFARRSPRTASSALACGSRGRQVSPALALRRPSSVLAAVGLCAPTAKAVDSAGLRMRCFALSITTAWGRTSECVWRRGLGGGLGSARCLPTRASSSSLRGPRSRGQVRCAPGWRVECEEPWVRSVVADARGAGHFVLPHQSLRGETRK